ncbi:NAD(P)/FAD-dependent oxidoreductase [Paracoccus saliphilus]|uniref:FAD-binding oxidoreductase n=1 Tax=Paracoccus saliphilus TaxID=405559 RepID=A0AA46A606_9RHOB|nr:FAD-binding oxidoreductase [Paracoccus saliphilus]WCR02108.1 FAD-binding oxidoreductase [Paracoccus saliphilus]SIS90089.1 Glycine/D-amino acid oxidase [Paracoccus saliphilus]
MTRNYSAKRLPKHAGAAGWNAILEPMRPARVLSENTEVDFAVIGGGFAGLSAARRLSQLNPGARIALLEAGRIGEGAAGRNSGFMIDLPHDLTSDNYAGESERSDQKITRLNRMAIDFAHSMVEEFCVDAAYFRHEGKINGAGCEASHARNISYAGHLEQLGEDYQLLDAEDMARLTGSRYYRSGLYTPGTVMLQPAGYVRQVATGLGDLVDIYEDTPALSFSRTGAGWTIRTPAANLDAGKIILCNNGHLESFGIKRGRLMHVFLFACMTEELDETARRRLGGEGRWGITPSDPMGATIRRIDAGQGGNRIVTRSWAEFCPGMETSERQMCRATASMRRKFDDRFPQIAGMPMEYSWSGHLCLSRNGVSVTGEIDDGVYAACCQNGLGTTRGTLTGICAAEQASREKSVVTEFFGKQEEPSLLPPPPISTLGATAILRWKEWQARKE